MGNSPNQPVLTSEERAKRQVVFVHRPEWVLVKVLAQGPLLGLRRIEREEPEVIQDQLRQAKARGVDPWAYRRGRPDTGLNVFASSDNQSGKEKRVRISELLAELEAAGYRMSHAHWYVQESKGPVNVIALRRGDTVSATTELESLPPETLRVLQSVVFNDVTIWANLWKVEGGASYRIDTVNCAKGLNQPGRSVHLHGNSYRIA